MTVVGTVATLIVGLGIAAYAANNLLQGHITHTERLNQTAPSSAFTKSSDKNSSPQSATSPKSASDLVDKYGTAAASPAVAAAIRKAERRPDAKAAADAYQALEHGVWKPGADPMQAIMHGYVPPGMPPQQAAMLYNAMPKLPRMPGAMTPDRIARMAGEPLDPVAAALPEGLSRDGVQAANQQMFDGYMRGRFGPVYVPPLHRDHNAAAQAIGKLPVSDNQMSLIEPEYNFDLSTGEALPPRVFNPGARSHTIREMTDSSGVVQSQFSYDPYGRQTQIAGTGPVPDFGYQGYYVHQRSGLNLTRTRAYSPGLGRFLNRDPIEEKGSSTNLFAYVGNNPISRQDPSGEMWKSCCNDPTVDCPKPGPYCPTVPPAKCAKDGSSGRTYFIRAFRRGYQKCVWSDNGDPEGGTYACEPTPPPQNCPD